MNIYLEFFLATLTARLDEKITGPRSLVVLVPLIQIMKEAHNWLGEQSLFIARGRGGGGGWKILGGNQKHLT